MKLNTKMLIFLIFLLLAGILTFLSAKKYEGNIFIYLLFTFSFNALLILGFCKHRIFFDTFIGIFFWLGFWFKFSVRIALMAGHFQEPVGRFDWTGAAYDHALLVSSCGALALLLAHYVRRPFFSYKSIGRVKIRVEALYGVYRRHRWTILVSFCCLFIIVACTNVIFGIYQRGTVPRTILPFGLSGIYTWLLLFGLSSFSAVILECEFQRDKNPYAASIIGLLECFFSNSSMLSRGMILNGISLLFGMHEKEKARTHLLSKSFKLILIVSFGLLFAFSVLTVNHIRMFRHAAPAMDEKISRLGTHSVPVVPAVSHHLISEVIGKANHPAKLLSVSEQSEPDRDIQKRSDNPKPQDVDIKTMMNWPVFCRTAAANLKLMLIDRWVGVEGAMAVSSYPHLGWGLWKRAWQEKFSHVGTSLYDTTILLSPYLKLDLSEFHFINLPGILAFFYYPGSYLFLFVGMFVAGSFGAAMEWFVYKFGGGNVILCSLMAQVLAYRYAHFGYAPRQTYMLIGTIVLNIIIIYAAIKTASISKATRQPAIQQ
jgi:hypothetical protein